MEDWIQTIRNLDYERIFSYLLEPPYLILLGVLAFIILVLIVLLRRQPKHFTARNVDVGKVFVSKAAIADLVRRVCASDERIARSSGKVQTRGGRLKIALKLKLVAGERLNDVASHLQDRVETVLRRNIGIENVSSINVMVKGFVGETPPDFERDPEPEPAPEPAHVVAPAVAPVAPPEESVEKRSEPLAVEEPVEEVPAERREPSHVMEPAPRPDEETPEPEPLSPAREEAPAGEERDERAEQPRER